MNNEGLTYAGHPRVGYACAGDGYSRLIEDLKSTGAQLEFHPFPKADVYLT